MIRRTISTPLVAVVLALFIIFFFYSSSAGRETWEGLLQRVGLGDHIGSSHAPGSSSSPAQGAQDPHYEEWNPRLNFKPGSPMPPGHNYTSLLVIAKTKEENIDWMDEALPDQPKAVYVADDPKAPLHPPKNKGHEVMVYLTWIIDNYDNLPDVTMFMHAHQLTWHNDDLLGNDAAQLVTRLSRQRVWREGFVNMRCSWYPGCPDWMHPGESEENAFKPEEVLLAKSWSELFPLDEVPSVLAQPCCAQFALSRERIQAKPYAQYVWYRDWLFNTKLPDSMSGRIWEYVWQFVFTGQSVNCPKEHICFCDQFGLCFGGEEAWSDFIVLKNELSDRERDLRDWEEKGKAIEEAKKKGEDHLLKTLEKPEEGKDAEFRREIDRLRPIVEGLKRDADERGKDPRNRALEAGRDWFEGDDY
ncbi:hypothetical protein HBI40_004610 [Parastagonospora nodorum]|nr:hypothetical protein HBI76_004270 [Parastagonospora nodorum]KAH5386024.1 hypothetical protein HBI33_080410 [Parastagonospora nodorum]KAH5430048.1 hypothetical protein HBI46_004540 [Parastagonospora nodorum]KAH5439559.1 hypothetical protein HBI47_049290 [Parastagonospora nodorum]KAH5704897.1 hypothetical protein HBI44_004670 [Parastagonospora nodorum]